MVEFICRDAGEQDATGISDVLRALFAAGKRPHPGDPDFALSFYITHPDQIVCTVAADPVGRILGFQSLKRAVENNPYDAPVGWGVIGTHIHPSAARRGIGRKLFISTLAAARDQALPAIDATIGTHSAEGLAYYEAMGFREYRTLETAVSKVLWLG